MDSNIEERIQSDLIIKEESNEKIDITKGALKSADKETVL